MKSLIIGAGETGTALYNVLKKHHETYLRDVEENNDIGSVSVMHICFPYSKNFKQDVKDYQIMYEPSYTIIHSTVPVGTSRGLGAYHSPIRGVHPHLEEGIRTFIKYLAPKNKTLKRYFKKAGIKIKGIDKPENTEAGKIWSTSYFGWNILFEKCLYKWCKKHNLDFDIIYKDFNKTYNEGYEKLGMKHVIRPILKQMKGRIGGHCILPNCRLLKNKITLYISKNG